MSTHIPSRATLATRSLSAALSKQGEARRQALAEHFRRFAPPVHRGACPVR